MIKTIHYCWFGGAPKSKLIEQCVASWKKFCPGYEIIEWNETNYDLNCCDYVKEAYRAKKWAFVSDYVRHDVLNRYGGIYLDTDVELIRSIDEISDTKYMGFEDEQSVNSGLIMKTEPNDWFCQAMLAQYQDDHFILPDGKCNLYTVCQRTVDILQAYGLVLNGATQKVKDYTIFAKDYFCPIDMKTGKLIITPNTYSIHRYAASWVDSKSKLRGKVYRFINRIFGEKTANFARKVLRGK